MTVPVPSDLVPPLVDQVEATGTWVADQYGDTSGHMTWIAAPESQTGARLVDQVHDEGIWQTGPGCSMTWHSNDEPVEDPDGQ